MRVAIFGGTGFVGGYLVDGLLASGHEPSLLVRAGSGNKVRQADRCRLVPGDLQSATAIATVLADCDATIYCVGILREDARRGITFEELQYAAVLRVAEAAKSLGVTRFLLMSSNGVKPAGTPYQDTKYRAEQYVRSGGLDVTVFRPSVIFGNPRGLMEIATQLYRDMVAPPLPAVGFYSGWKPGQGDVLMSPVHVEDVAQAFLGSLGDPGTVGSTYTLGGPEILSWTEMLRRVARAAGRNKWILPMPIGAMRLAATLFDRMNVFPVTRDQLTMLEEGNIADPDELQSLVGRPPRAFSAENLAYLSA